MIDSYIALGSNVQDPANQLRQAVVPAPDEFPRRQVSGVYFLGHMCHAHMGQPLYLASVCTQFTEQQSEQAGLAATVCTDQCQALPGLDG